MTSGINRNISGLSFGNSEGSEGKARDVAIALAYVAITTYGELVPRKFRIKKNSLSP
jgi:hypothetical protein